MIGGLAEIEIYAPDAFSGGSEPSPTRTPTLSPTATSTPELVASPIGTATETTVESETATALPAGSPTESAASPVSDEPIIETPTESLTDTSTPVPATATSVAESGTPTPYAIAGISRSANSDSGVNAFDRDPDTTWSAPVTEGTPVVAVLAVDLGAPAPIGSVRILPGTTGLAGDATIELSTDALTWHPWATLPATAPPDADGWITVVANPPVDLPPVGQYLRIVYTGPAPSGTVGNLAELQIYPP